MKTIVQTKRVEWSYPSSTNAKRFKFKAGCYTVELVAKLPHTMPGEAIAGFATIEEAKAHADSLPMPYDRFTR